MKAQKESRKFVLDKSGNKIYFGKFRLSDGYNTLKYSEIRRAVKEKDTLVNTFIPLYRNNEDRGVYHRVFGKVGTKTFYIGCHGFDLVAFNRILRHAGVKTTKKKTAALVKRAW